jgi:hypothetical protein
MSEETYKYEWLRTYTAILNQLLADLGYVCLCPKMTASQDWQFLCIVYGTKKENECCVIDYYRHNLEAYQNILTDRSFYCERTDIKGRSVLVFPQMFKNIHKMIAHTYYNYKDVFNKYEENIVSTRDYFSFVESIKYLTKKTF